jgi:hypothetical protein
MASFTPPTFEEPFQNRLGDYGVAFPVGLVVWIADADDAVTETQSIRDPEDIDLAKAGSGDFGKAIFRRGLAYTITAGEETILNAAGYTTT